VPATRSREGVVHTTLSDYTIDMNGGSLVHDFPAASVTRLEITLA